MKCLYIETSAVLAWLMGEKDARKVIVCIDSGEHVVSSIVSRIETERALIRAENDKLLSPSERQKIRGLFNAVSSSWSFLGMTAEVVDRASRPFPVEPLRSLDAIHLASALELIQVYPDMKILTFDKRIIENIGPLGLESAL